MANRNTLCILDVLKKLSQTFVPPFGIWLAFHQYDSQAETRKLKDKMIEIYSSDDFKKHIRTLFTFQYTCNKKPPEDDKSKNQLGSSIGIESNTIPKEMKHVEMYYSLRDKYQDKYDEEAKNGTSNEEFKEFLKVDNAVRTFWNYSVRLYLLNKDDQLNLKAEEFMGHTYDQILVEVICPIKKHKDCKNRSVGIVDDICAKSCCRYNEYGKKYGDYEVCNTDEKCKEVFKKYMEKWRL